MPHGRKLTKQEITEMRRQRREDGLHPTQIAKNFSIGRSTAYKHTKTVRILKASKHYKKPKDTLVKSKPKAERDLLQLRLAIHHLETKIDQLLGIASSSEIRRTEDSQRWKFLGRNPFRKEV